ncbi:Acyl-CoA N-acyltransferase [Penicillium angulare]|uniref:Acyl-CoA N-acyltransferase n=1 Tax=Penicillium angulare TaxID=116970 RepID=UPI002542239E|nr:Acyl-CoA N-acyltransferase [Penicillium angulare]KAJ5291553.1 Acyl-CoA N-acyltransferase [Penicillium angulare]
MEIEVLPLTEADIPGAVAVIQQAFADDPYFKWVFDSSTMGYKKRNIPSRKREALYLFLSINFPPPIIGVSCWLPPKTPTDPETWSSWFSNWILSFNQLLNNIRYFGRGGLRTNRYWIWKTQQEKAQEEIWDDPRGYYFCNIVAVGNDVQGKGVGRVLFEAVTKIADLEGVKCYLESSKDEPNVRIYERMGFQMTRTMECRDGEDTCMLYCMTRNPKT